MFSSTIKRSVATLGIVAGLLAAAVPANAETPGAVMPSIPNDSLLEGTQVGSEGVKAPTKADASDGREPQGYSFGISEGHMAPPNGAEAAKGGGFADLLVSSVRSGPQDGQERLALDDYGPHMNPNAPADDQTAYYLESAWPSQIDVDPEKLPTDEREPLSYSFGLSQMGGS